MSNSRYSGSKAPPATDSSVFTGSSGGVRVVNKSFTRRTTVDTQHAAAPPTQTADNWSCFLAVVRETDSEATVAVGTVCSLADNKSSFH